MRVIGNTQNFALKVTFVTKKAAPGVGTAFGVMQRFWILLDRIRQYGTVDKAAGGGGNGDVIGAPRRWRGNWPSTAASSSAAGRRTAGTAAGETDSSDRQEHNEERSPAATARCNEKDETGKRRS